MLSYPKVIPGLPFSDAGTTYFSSNSYALACGGAVGTGKAQIGKERRGRQAVDEVRGPRVAHRARFALGSRTWHVSRPRSSLIF